MGISRPWGEGWSKTKSDQEKDPQIKGRAKENKNNKGTYINIKNNNFACSNRVLTHVQEQYIPLKDITFNTLMFHISSKAAVKLMYLEKLSLITLLKPGSMLPERTTTTGDSLPVTHIKAFHMIKADVTIIPTRIQHIEQFIIYFCQNLNSYWNWKQIIQRPINHQVSNPVSSEPKKMSQTLTTTFTTFPLKRVYTSKYACKTSNLLRIRPQFQK